MSFKKLSISIFIFFVYTSVANAADVYFNDVYPILRPTKTYSASSGSGIDQYAAGLARAYNGGVNTDWYLPSMDELGEMFIKKDIIGGFAPNEYWSSTEELGTILDAKFQDFNSGNVDKNTKWTLYRVRAIRAF